MAEQWFRASGVDKSYDGGDSWANRGIDLSIGPGEVFGLLGANGAGKSTLVKQIIGLLKPDSGSIHLGPVDLVADPDHARQLCSYLPQAPMPINSFTVRQAIEITGRIRGGDPALVSRRAHELAEALQLEEWWGTVGMRLSGGVKRLTGFAMTAVVPGSLVILDEPTNDVDPLRRRLLWEQVRRLGSEGAAVLLVTHNVLEAEKSVDRLAIIDEGRVIAEGTPSSLKASDRGHLRLQVMIPPGNPSPELPEYASESRRVGNTLHAVVPEAAAGDGIAWAQRLLDAGSIEEYALGATTLEDVYVRLGAGAAR